METYFLTVGNVCVLFGSSQCLKWVSSVVKALQMSLNNRAIMPIWTCWTKHHLTIQLLLAVFPLFILVYSCLEKQANGISHPIIRNTLTKPTGNGNVTKWDLAWVKTRYVSCYIECERVVCQSNTHVNARIEQDVTRWSMLFTSPVSGFNAVTEWCVNK